MRKATQSSGNHHGLGHTPKSFVYLASADVQSEHHLPLLPRQPWESFSMEKLNQLFMLCNWLSTRGPLQNEGYWGVLLLPWFSQTLFFIKAYWRFQLPPQLSVLRRGDFFEKSLRPHRSHHQSRTPCLLQWRFPAALGKVSGTSFQVFVSPAGPWCPAEPRCLPSSGFGVSGGLWGKTYGFQSGCEGTFSHSMRHFFEAPLNQNLQCLQ